MFEGPRQNEYPNKPLAQTMAGSLMEAACKTLGYNTFSAPSANSSEVYTNPEGLTLGACEYCGHCERFRLQSQRQGITERLHPAEPPGRSEVRVARLAACARRPMSTISSPT